MRGMSVVVGEHIVDARPALRMEGDTLVPTEEMLTLLTLYSLRAKRDRIDPKYMNIYHRGRLLWGTNIHCPMWQLMASVVEWNRKP